MNDKNIYILGAGFSKELGLPLQEDFLLKAKDVYSRHSDKYPHFKKIFDYQDELSKIRNYLSVPLLNLESLFNLLEMHRFYTGDNRYKELKADYINLIKDVLIELTPPPVEYTSNSPSMADIYNKYMKFIYTFVTKKGKTFSYNEDTVINFNYDLAFENTVALFNQFKIDSIRDSVPFRMKMKFEKTNFDIDDASKYFKNKDSFKFLFPAYMYSDESTIKHIKLHGSINWQINGETFIIPPTWNKSDDRVRLLWEEAYNELSTAKRIVIIGYSFPETDIYVKSLIALAINTNKRLQGIFFINPDTGLTKERCLSFIDEHFKMHCEYKPWSFGYFMNSSNKDSANFINNALNRRTEI